MMFAWLILATLVIGIGICVVIGVLSAADLFGMMLDACDGDD